MKRFAPILAAVLLSALLSGCGSIFAGDYYHETDYSLPASEDRPSQKSVTVKDAGGLQKELLAMVYAGKSDGVIAFDPEYAGDSKADMEAAVGTMHRADALWAYCVQNVRYEISHIVTHDEASVHIEYAESALGVDEVLRLNYASGLERLIRGAMEEGREHLVILIDKSTYSADAMLHLVTDVYRSNPASAAAEPNCDVYMYSGAGRQRLYDVEFDYGMDSEALQARRDALAAFDAREIPGGDEEEPARRALAACRYLVEHCALSESRSRNTAYDALIEGEADSEGLALGYLELCRRLGVGCKLVDGQKLWHDHCWNIVELDGQHYHVDLTACLEEGMAAGFLRSDADMWSSYRWDTSSYELCAGELDYWTVSGETKQNLPTDGQEPPEESDRPEPPEESEEPELPEESEAPQPPEQSESPGAETEPPPSESETP